MAVDIVAILENLKRENEEPIYMKVQTYCN